MRTVEPVETIGAPAARRAVLAAQGFGAPRAAGPVTRRHLRALLERQRLLQLDSVNVAVRAHYMPVFSRLGPYDRELVDDAAWSHSARRPRLLVEYWAHEASLLPVADWPLLLSGAKRRGWWKHYAGLVEQAPGLVEDILAAVKELGPVGAGGLEKALGAASAPRPSGVGWWQRSDVKRVCEWMFGMGLLTTGTRVHFQRLYDLPERVLPPEVLSAPTPSPEEAARRLVRQAAVALGVATEPDVRDYYRLGPEASRQALTELVEAGEIEPIADALTSMPEVDYIVVTAGSFDLIAEVVCESDDHLLELLSKRIRAISGVRSTETFVYLKLHKQTYSWGVR